MRIEVNVGIGMEGAKTLAEYLVIVTALFGIAALFISLFITLLNMLFVTKYVRLYL